jgi:hypothetical protein
MEKQELVTSLQSPSMERQAKFLMFHLSLKNLEIILDAQHLRVQSWRMMEVHPLLVLTSKENSLSMML